MLISFFFSTVIRPVILRQRGQMKRLQWDRVPGKDRVQTSSPGLQEKPG